MTSYMIAKDDTKVPSILGREPALVSGVITAGVALATAFGFDLDADQVAAITAFVAAVVAFVTRAKVSPTYKAVDGHLPLAEDTLEDDS